MTNPYNQPLEYFSTAITQFNPYGVAHYVRPVSYPDVYVETNNTLNRIIASDPTRAAGVEALVKEKRAQHEAEEAAAAAAATEARRAQEFDAAIKQHREEETATINWKRRVRCEAAMNQGAEEEATAATATAKQTENCSEWRDCCLQRYLNGHEKPAAENEEEEDSGEGFQKISLRADDEVTLVDCHSQLEKWDLQHNARINSKAAFDAWYDVGDQSRRKMSQSSNATGRQVPLRSSSLASEPETCCGFDYCYGFCADIKSP